MNIRRVAVLAALPAEAATLQRLGERWITRTTGVGPAAAEAAARRVMAETPLSALISWGTCGGLDASLSGGTLVVLSRVTSATSGKTFTCAPLLSNQLAGLLKPVRAVIRAGLTCDAPVVTTAEKATLRQKHQVSVVDMESSAVAAVAEEFGVPFLAVRAVVDPASCTLPVSALAALEDPEHPTRAVLQSLRRHPFDLVALMRLGLWHQRALRGLRGAALMMEYAPDFPPREGRES
jgi:adenosylhomocysteine nucleosidase